MALQNFTNVTTLGGYLQQIDNSTGGYFFPVISITATLVMLITAFTSPGKKANMAVPFMAGAIFSMLIGAMFINDYIFLIGAAQFVLAVAANFLNTKGNTEM